MQLVDAQDRALRFGRAGGEDRRLGRGDDTELILEEFEDDGGVVEVLDRTGNMGMRSVLAGRKERTCRVGNRPTRMCDAE